MSSQQQELLQTLKKGMNEWIQPLGERLWLRLMGKKRTNTTWAAQPSYFLRPLYSSHSCANVWPLLLADTFNSTGNWRPWTKRPHSNSCCSDIWKCSSSSGFVSEHKTSHWTLNMFVTTGRKKSRRRRRCWQPASRDGLTHRTCLSTYIATVLHRRLQGLSSVLQNKDKSSPPGAAQHSACGPQTSWERVADMSQHAPECFTVRGF